MKCSCSLALAALASGLLAFNCACVGPHDRASAQSETTTEAPATDDVEPVDSPLPTGPPLEKADKLVRDIYYDDLEAASDDAERRAVVRTMIDDLSSTEVPTEQYALLLAAHRTAASISDIELIAETVAELSERFAVDALAMQADALIKADDPNLAQDHRKNLALAMLALSRRAVDAERFDVAEQLTQAVVQLNKDFGDFELEGLVEDQAAEVRELKSAFDQAARALDVLKRSPDDAEACLVAGKYLCFVRGDWEQGLPLLAKGNDAELSKLAQQELAKPDAPADQAALADGWWSLAENEKGHIALKERAHAVAWYYRAVGELQGLRKAHVERTLEQFASANPDSFDAIRRTADAEAHRVDVELADGPIRLTITKVGVLQDESDRSPVTGVEFSVDLEHFVSFSSRPEITMWDFRSQSSKKLSSHTEPVRAAAFQTAFTLPIVMATAGDDKTVRLWNCKTYEVQTTFQGGHTGPVVDLAFFPYGRYDGKGLAAVSASDNEICVWSREGGLTQKLKGRCPAIAPQGTVLAYSAEGEVRLWFSLEQREAKLQGKGLDVCQMRFAPDGRTLAASCAGDESGVCLWDLAALDVGRPFYSQSGGRGNMREWDLTALDVEPRMIPCANGARIAFSSDGKTLAITGPRELVLFDVESLVKLAVIHTTKEVQAIALCGDGAHLAIVEKGSPAIQLFRIDVEVRHE